MDKEKQSSQTTEITTTTSLNNVLDRISDAYKKGEVVDTGHIDDDLPSSRSRVGCSKCKLGYIINENGDSEYCDCYLKYQFTLKMKKSNIPPDYFNWDRVDIKGLKSKRKMFAQEPIPENLNSIEINRMLENFNLNIHKTKEQGWNVIFEGPTGSGKTTAAAIAGKHALRNGYSVIFVELEELRKVWTGEPLTPSLEKIKREIHNVDFLILDDIGGEFMSERSDHQITQLDLLIRKRISNLLPTIYTTNANYEQISERYQGRISSLLKMRMVHILMFTKEDVRETSESPEFLFD